MSVDILAPVDFHLLTVAARMRACDVEEVKAASGRQPLDALRHAVEVSQEAHTGLIDGEPVCVFGVSGQWVWMLGTDGIDADKRRMTTFARKSAEVVGDLIRRHGVLKNFVFAKNKRTLRWLRWLGFEIDPPAPFGVSGKPFHRVTLTMEAQGV